MEYMPGLLAELNDWCERSPAHRLTQNHTGAGPLALRQLAMLKTELLDACILISVATSIANAIAREDFEHLCPGSIAKYCPQSTTSFQKTMDWILSAETDCPTALARHIQSYCSRLAMAKKLCICFTEENKTPNTHKTIDVTALADAWQRVCLAAVELNQALNTYLETAGELVVIKTEISTVRLLKLAKSGKSPCLDEDGRIHIPGWAERRRDNRRPTDFQVTALIRGKTETVTVLDLSPGGAKLSAAAGIGERVIVRFENGLEVLSIVRWTKRGQIGVRFHERIELADAGH
jgi:hypothetical protein